MSTLTFEIRTNSIGRTLGLHQVASTDPDKGFLRARLDRLLNPLLDWVCEADRSSAIEALDVLKSANTAGSRSEHGDLCGDGATLDAYLKLKSLATKEYRLNFSEQLSSGNLKLCIAGLDADRSVSIAVPAQTHGVREMVWSQIAEHITPPNTHLARTAIDSLLNAGTVTQQVAAYAELLDYAREPLSSALTWQIPANEGPVFRLGTLDIPYCASPREPVAQRDLPLDACLGTDSEDLARALCSMHYDEQWLVAGFHDFGARNLTELNTDAMIKLQSAFMQQAPQLVDALKLLGLHRRRDDNGEYAWTFGLEVERIAAGMHRGNGDAQDFGSRCSSNAQRLMGCLQDLEERAQNSPLHIAPSRLA